jgi:uncharacterized membrane protein (UPF0127 family)
MRYKRGFFSIILLVMSLFLVSCTKTQIMYLDNGAEKIPIEAELADSIEKMQMGLMFRESLDENSGMLFAFDKEYQYTFWMKNTLIPLDIIFISSDFQVVDIINAVPCEEDSCISYEPKDQAKYVLEVNSGFASKNNIKIGDKLIVDTAVTQDMIKKVYKGEYRGMEAAK